MKYLMVEDFSGQALPIIFPERIAFDEMREQLPYGTVLSAGLVELADTGFSCFGGAPELGLHPRPEDREIIAARFKPRAR